MTFDATPGGTPQRFWLGDLSIRQPVFITMLILATMVVGGIAYSRMGLDLFPDIAFPVVAVRTVYPGANPAEVERSVTEPIEEAVASLSGVESVRSTTGDSVSLVIVEFKLNRSAKESLEEVRTRINGMRSTLPAEAKEPVVQRFDPSQTPIISLGVADATGARTPEQVRTLAEDVLKPRLERQAGVAAATVSGGPVREIHVDLRLRSLEAHSVSAQQIILAARTESLDVPAGRVASGGREELWRTVGQVRSLEQIGEIPVVSGLGGAPIRLKEIADISDGFAEVRTISRLDGQESVILEVRKQSGTNTVQVADAVKAEMARLQIEYPDITFATGFDQSTFTKEAVQDLQLSLALGALLAAIVVLLFFRDWRNTLVTVAGLPVILLGTFAVLSVLGMSLNMITMMALALSIGMLIDDAIVVRENIFRHMERGEAPKAAASRGTAEIALAVVAMTSTIVAVFLPVAFTEGIAGRFLRDFGVTIAVAVTISLLEAFTLAPMLSAYFFRPLDPRRAAQGRPGRFSGWFEALSGGYRGLLGWALQHRAVVVVAGGAAFAGSLVVVRFMVFSFAPQTDQGELGLGIELEPGARLERTDRAARAVEAILQSDADVRHVFTTVGSSDGAVEKASLSVKLRQRGHTQQVISRLRPLIEEAVGDAKFSMQAQSTESMMGGGAIVGAIRGRPIQFTIQGEDFSVLDRVSADLLARLRQVPGAVDLDRTIKDTRPGGAIVPDRTRATDLGVTVAQVGSTVRALVNGERVGAFRSEDKDIDIIVRLAAADRSTAADLLRVPIGTARGTTVPLSRVASLAQAEEPDQIYRENRQRTVVVGGGYSGRDLASVLAEARAEVRSMTTPKGVSVKLSGSERYTDETFTSLGIALALAVLFVYMILASQFGSFVHPLTIMLALPFSVIGALLALFVSRFSFDMLGMIGIIMLMGLVSKNSILVVEFVNQLRRRGLPTREAILQAGPIRLRPILMTTLAMIFGMVPAAAGLGAGAEMRQPMGVSVIGGLITSTLLTLVVVPVAYSLMDDLGRLVGRRRRGPGRPEGPADVVEAREPALTA